MRLQNLLLATMLFFAACATASQPISENRTLSFGCNDVVVIGTIENRSYHPVETQDDLLGHGWISGTVNVRKVVRGARVPPILPVRYFAHAYMREDRNFMFVLKPAGMDHEIATAQLMSQRPRLAGECE